jgi:hypothetical protein
MPLVTTNIIGPPTTPRLEGSSPPPFIINDIKLYPCSCCCPCPSRCSCCCPCRCPCCPDGGAALVTPTLYVAHAIAAPLSSALVAFCCPSCCPCSFCCCCSVPVCISRPCPCFYRCIPLLYCQDVDLGGLRADMGQGSRLKSSTGAKA